MTKNILYFCFIFILSVLNLEATGKNNSSQTEWKEYISSFPSVIPPYYWASDEYKPIESHKIIHTNKNIFSEGNVFNTRRIISRAFLKQFIPTEIQQKESIFYYGGKYQRGETFITVIFQETTRKSSEKEYTFLVVYKDGGIISDWKTIRNVDFSLGLGILLDEWVWTDTDKHDKIRKIDSEGMLTVKDTIVTKIDKDNVDALPITYDYYIDNSGIIRNGNSYIGKTYSRSNVKRENIIYSIIGNEEVFPIRFTRIEEAYNEYLGTQDESYKRASVFFDVFPNRWREIVELYSFSPDSKLSMYSVVRGIEHIKGLRMLEGIIPDSIYIKKIMQLVIGGDDNSRLHSINKEFHSLLSHLLHKKTNVCFNVLGRMSRDFQFDFWRYYILTTFGFSSEFTNIEKDYRKTYPEEVEIMKTALSYYGNRNPMLL